MSITRKVRNEQSSKKRREQRRKDITKAMKANRSRNKEKLSSEAAVRFAKRKDAVEAVRRGEPVSTVARIHGVPPRTVFRWLAKAGEKGINGLYDEARSGRPSKLTPQIMQWLYNAVTDGNPLQYSFEFALWTLTIIRGLLIEHHGIELNKSTISRLMKKMGLTPQTPLYQSYRKNSGKVSYYLNKRYPKLKQWCAANQSQIFFADESRVRADSHQGTTWAPVGETPVVEDSGDRFGINMISAVSSRGAMYFECFEGRMDSERFIAFLRKLRKQARTAVAVVVDGGSYHKSKAVKDFIKEKGEKLGIQLLILPPYSPELNPDEQVWNQAKKKLGKMSIKTKAILKAKTQEVLSDIKSSRKLVRSFFQLPDTRYAA
jgi:transposase